MTNQDMHDGSDNAMVSAPQSNKISKVVAPGFLNAGNNQLGAMVQSNSASKKRPRLEPGAKIHAHAHGAGESSVDEEEDKELPYALSRPGDVEGYANLSQLLS